MLEVYSMEGFKNRVKAMMQSVDVCQGSISPMIRVILRNKKAEVDGKSK